MKPGTAGTQAAGGSSSGDGSMRAASGAVVAQRPGAALKGKGGGKSEDLSKTLKSDELENEYGGYNEDDDGEDERAMFEELEKKQKERNSSLWEDPSLKTEKGRVLQTLIQQFSMIVQKEDVFDENGDPTMEVEYTKLPSALKAIKKIHRCVARLAQPT